ncbi:alpha-glucan family phosphorylase [Candidatus Falkowbacteria bacterium]|nr:alpha-glucan family phosphorylase [Candidatus Falkowbacteria bacterium]
MEIGLQEGIPTYSGGLGILAGDATKSAADLGIPFIAVTMLNRKGYFKQELTKTGRQIEHPVKWNPKKYLKPLPFTTEVHIHGRRVLVKPWLYTIQGAAGAKAHVLFLDTDLKENILKDRKISYFLYGGDSKYRLKQEIVLGVGGVRILKSLGVDVKKYHMNEGHAAFLTLELLRMNNFNLEKTRKACVFTTHTPVAAGHDQFDYELTEEQMEPLVAPVLLRKLCGKERLNMTKLAFSMSNYVNGVAKQHKQVSEKMFPGYEIHAITNGVHSYTWTHPAFRKIYDKYISGWANEPELFIRAPIIPNEEIWASRDKAKKDLLDYVNRLTGVGMKKDVLTIGFARRATAYKRHNFIFSDLPRLKEISKRYPLQIIFAGKAHPRDENGKKIIQEVFKNIQKLKRDIKIVYLPNYDIEMAKKLTSGCDVWLNNPERPMEASGTSGMKAAHNGVLNFSVLDGWWLEGFVEAVTGWSIGPGPDEKIKPAEAIKRELEDLYTKLEYTILPMYYERRDDWMEMMENSISKVAYYFNTHRMMRRYVLYAYL